MAKKHKNHIQITRFLDLHGKLIQDAYESTREFLDYCKSKNHKYVRIITGKSGDIYKEFPFWVENFGYSVKIQEIGSYVIKTN